MSDNTLLEVTPTQFGFIWEDVEVQRTVNLDRYGKVITISTPKESIQIRITPTGLIRVDKRGRVHDIHS